jgi:hypothetical protein
MARATVSTTICSAPSFFKARAHAATVAPEVYTSSTRSTWQGIRAPGRTVNERRTFLSRAESGNPAWGLRSRVLRRRRGSQGHPVRRPRKRATSAGKLYPLRKYLPGRIGTGTIVGRNPAGNRSAQSSRIAVKSRRARMRAASLLPPYLAARIPSRTFPS